MSVDWREVAAADLTVPVLYDALRLRSRVFVVEQDCAYQDVDGLDLATGTWHVLGYDDADLVAYARVLDSTPAASHSPSTEGCRIGRVIVADSHRGRQVGRELVQRCVDLCRRTQASSVVLSAQAHLVDFYASLGFAAEGEPYDEDGIPHVDMRLSPSPR